LALQGAFESHCRALAQLGHEVREVRVAEQLDDLDGLVLPGGESTTMLKLARWGGLEAHLNAFAATGKPVLGTCAGLILSAREVVDPEQQSYGWLDVKVQRNGYGRQLDSFEATSDGGQPLVFIRAPRILSVGPDVEQLDSLDGEPILVRQGNVYGACYHPELVDPPQLLSEIFGGG
jgi:5'-phosphate synthase pdxT subunit